MYHMDAGAVVGVLLIVVGLPLVTTVITGGICGVKMAGLSWWGGIMIGVACAPGTVIGMAITNAWFDLDSYISIAHQLAPHEHPFSGYVDPIFDFGVPPLTVIIVVVATWLTCRRWLNLKALAGSVRRGSG